MVEIIACSVLIIGLFVIAISFYMLWRNKKVCEIRMKIIDIFYTEKNLTLYDNGPSYDEMLNQFWKPITLEYWLKEFRK